MKFGPDGTTTIGPPDAAQGETGNVRSTSAPTTQSDLIESAAYAAHFPETYALWIDEVMKFAPEHTISLIPAMAAYYEANPGAGPGQIAQAVAGATPQQAAAINGLQSSNSDSSGADSGLASDLFGDFVMVAYPFLMMGLGALLFILWALISLVAIAKAPATGGLGSIARTAARAA
jgi:hypothetical protein